jgi:RimJ/RimL family protein N-acetyltransferase
MDLVGELVTLRAQRDDDATGYATILADAPTVRQLAQWSRPPAGVTEELEFLRARPAHTQNWAIEITSAHNLVGACGLADINTVSRRADFGIFIGPPSQWGHGYGAEATRLTVGYAFHHLNLRKVTLHVYAGNDRAQRVYERCGFAVEAVLPHHTWLNGAYVAETLMAVYRDNPLYAPSQP